jgi:pyruvate kinase
MPTSIIATIGPACSSLEVLKYFKKHTVTIGRLNFSHNTSLGHIESAQTLQEAGLEVMVDLGGPKIRFGNLIHEVDLQNGFIVCLEVEDPNVEYPFDTHYKDKKVCNMPCRFEIGRFVKPGRMLLLDDGKVRMEVIEVIGKKVYCEVIVGGKIKTAKSINLPYSEVDLPFLTDRDKLMLKETLHIIRPQYVAASFVKKASDVSVLRNFIQYCIDEKGITDYKPKICVKVETHEVLEDDVLDKVIEGFDIIMIARGDMALETLPAHIMVPMYQEKIVEHCRTFGKPFIVATEALDSMITKPTPSRAEVSDIYRSIALDKADFVMLSGESAIGMYPREAVKLMDDMIKQYSK